MILLREAQRPTIATLWATSAEPLYGFDAPVKKPPPYIHTITGSFLDLNNCKQGYHVAQT